MGPGHQVATAQGPLHGSAEFYRRLPPQFAMDSDPRDGPMSVAAEQPPHVVKVWQQRPAPQTPQYRQRQASEVMAPRWAPRQATDICGWAQAAVDPSNNGLLWDTNEAESGRMNIKHNEDRRVFMCISGWALMMWRSEDDFLFGKDGAKNAPRPLAWWDLRTAHDVMLENGDIYNDQYPYRISIPMSRGCVFFRVELAPDVPVWFLAIRRVIQDAFVGHVESRDTKYHQQRRWAAAVGMVQCLQSGSAIGSRGLAIAFHAYDLDYNCCLETGEIMVLIKELHAAIAACDGRAEGDDRDVAVMAAEARLPEDDLFERAMRFRKRCDDHGNGKIRKDEFIHNGNQAMLEALDFPLLPDDMGGPPRQDVCQMQ